MRFIEKIFDFSRKKKHTLNYEADHNSTYRQYKGDETKFQIGHAKYPNLDILLLRFSRKRHSSQEPIIRPAIIFGLECYISSEGFILTKYTHMRNYIHANPNFVEVDDQDFYKFQCFGQFTKDTDSDEYIGGLLK